MKACSVRNALFEKHPKKSMPSRLGEWVPWSQPYSWAVLTGSFRSSGLTEWQKYCVQHSHGRLMHGADTVCPSRKLITQPVSNTPVLKTLTTQKQPSGTDTAKLLSAGTTLRCTDQIGNTNTVHFEGCTCSTHTFLLPGNSTAATCMM